MSFFTSTVLRPMSQEQIARKAPAVYATAPKSTTSDKYLFVSTQKLIDSLGKYGWNVVAASQTMNRGSTSEAVMTNKHALFLAPQDMLEKQFNYGDTMPLMKIENAHNGAASFHMTTGFFRKACANGLTVPESIFAAPKIKHTKDMANDVVEAAYTVMKDFPKLTEMQKVLSHVQLNTEERLLLLDTASDIFFDRETRELQETMAKKQFRPERWSLVDQLGAAQRYQDRKNDLWTVTNVIQENLIRGNVRLLSETGHARSQRKVTSIDRDNDIHEKLFAMTAKFAELKGVRITA